MKDNKLSRVEAVLGEDAVSRIASLSIATGREDVLESMVNASLHAYLLSSHLGELKYGENGNYGRVFVSKFNNRNPYRADISFAPKGAAQRSFRCVQMVIGILDYSDRTYNINPCSSDVLDEVSSDVEGAMQMFGLKKSAKPYSREED
jgi:hypothetical protein